MFCCLGIFFGENMADEEITSEYLRKILNYDKLTGFFSWRENTTRNRKNGKIAGGMNRCGYWRITICGKSYLAHRLAWLYVYGFIPLSHIDHIDRDPLNNRISNLRTATRSENLRNSKAQTRNTCMVTGVCEDKKRRNRFQAYIGVGGRSIKLGWFRSIKDAAKARYDAEKLYGYSFLGRKSSAEKYLSAL